LQRIRIHALLHTLSGLASSVSTQRNLLECNNFLSLFQTEKIELEEKKEYDEQNILRLMRAKDEHDAEIGALREALEGAKLSYEEHCLRLESEANETKAELEERIKGFKCLIAVSTNKIRELEEISEYKIHKLKKRELRYHCFIDSHLGCLQVDESLFFVI